MRQYERAGVTLDQCSECRGIFLDRGELEKLIDGETAWHGGGGRPTQSPPVPAPPPQYGYDQRHGSQHYGDQHYGDQRYGHGQHPHKKRRGFLEELFD